MKIELTYFGSVSEGGVLTIRDRKSFDKYLMQFSGHEVTIDIKIKRSKRSIQQNSFFHSWVALLSDHTGYTRAEMKDILKWEFLQIEKVNEKTGRLYKCTRDTSSLNKSQFADFCTEIQHWSETEFGARLPLPNEQWEISFI